NAQEGQKNEVEVFADADHRHDFVLQAEHRARTYQKVQHVRKGDEITEGDPREKQKDGGEKKTGNGASLVLVKGRSNKKPDLIEHYGRSQDNPKVYANRDNQVERPCRMGVDEFFIE